MSEHSESEPDAATPGPAQRTALVGHREDLITRQMRTVGQRRADAEQKLARHLKEAHHATEEHPAAAETPPDD